MLVLFTIGCILKLYSQNLLIVVAKAIRSLESALTMERCCMNAVNNVEHLISLSINLFNEKILISTLIRLPHCPNRQLRLEDDRLKMFTV